MGFLQNLFQKKPKVNRVDVTKRFELITRIGQGSMSRFFKARDTLTGKIVGLKLLDKEKTKKFEARFAAELKKPTEGEIAVSLNHPNVVRTLEWGESFEGEPFLVMEFLDGVGLSFLIDVQNETMRQHRLSLMIQIGEGIEYLHQNRWIHRDLCPRNMIVTEADHVLKLIDFGLVVPNTPPFQVPGNRTGTANYMAPELIRRQKTDHRIDIYSYAVTCFEMFTRRHPWPEATSIDAVIQHINSPPMSIDKLVPDIDPQVAQAIMKGLEQDPAKRWQRASQMVELFQEAAARLPMQPEPKPAPTREQSRSATSSARPDVIPARSDRSVPATNSPSSSSSKDKPATKKPRAPQPPSNAPDKRPKGLHDDDDMIMDILSQ